jgi:hypothetical protein
MFLRPGITLGRAYINETVFHLKGIKAFGD